MSDFRSLTLQTLCAELRPSENTLVVIHRHPDGDAVGSGFGLRLLLEAMGCRTYCVCEDEIPERLRFLVGDKQESILPENLPEDFTPSQIITVDTASPTQMGRLFSMYEGKIDLMIDHHAKGMVYADGWVNGSASSAGEMIFALSRELLKTGRVSEILPDVDKLLYAAVSSDTGCFRYSNVTPATHACAAELLSGGGFDPAEINHLLFEVKSEKLLMAERLGAERLRRYCGGVLGIITFPASLKKAHGFTDEHLETLVDIPRSLEGVQIAVAVRQPTDAPVFRVSMRSNTDFDVAAVCARFGGGGHIKAAGCTIDHPDITTTEQAAEAVAAVVVGLLTDAE